ncbi:hypothetical protein HDV00_011266 [Rhizophlyctis rosea]|nr:hypothetical protein HDV00_011266 [Rhizophlyctis rosea]
MAEDAWDDDWEAAEAIPAPAAPKPAQPPVSTPLALRPIQTGTDRTEYVPQVKILRRDPKSLTPQMERTPSGNSTKSHAEREAEYQAARARIFASSSNPTTTTPSPPPPDNKNSKLPSQQQQPQTRPPNRNTPPPSDKQSQPPRPPSQKEKQPTPDPPPQRKPDEFVTRAPVGPPAGASRTAFASMAGYLDPNARGGGNDSQAVGKGGERSQSR